MTNLLYELQNDLRLRIFFMSVVFSTLISRVIEKISPKADVNAIKK